jgi:hypothetical protein
MLSKEYEGLIKRVAKIDEEAAEFLKTEMPKLEGFEDRGNLSGVIVWDDTPQGHEYWHEIYMELPPLKWSTEKFAKDILWACEEGEVSLEVALEKISHLVCPVISILHLGNRIIGPNVLMWYKGPYCDEMAPLWERDKNLNARRIKGVKQWFKKNGYIK